MEFLDHQNALLDDLSIESTDLFFTDDQIKRFINRSLKWFAGLYLWDQTEYSYTIDSEANQEYYDYPEDFLNNSIYRLEFNSKEYGKRNYEDYLRYQRDFTNPSDKIFATHRRQYFINEAPTVVATISIWGHKRPDTLVEDTDSHFFSFNDALGEIINKYALGLALTKARGRFLAVGRQLKAEALIEANLEWEKQLVRRAEEQSQENSMFSDIEIIPSLDSSGRRSNPIGNFN